MPGSHATFTCCLAWLNELTRRYLKPVRTYLKPVRQTLNDRLPPKINSVRSETSANTGSNDSQQIIFLPKTKKTAKHFDLFSTFRDFNSSENALGRSGIIPKPSGSTWNARKSLNITEYHPKIMRKHPKIVEKPSIDDPPWMTING